MEAWQEIAAQAEGAQPEQAGEERPLGFHTSETELNQA